jgi:hypothetical protein
MARDMTNEERRKFCDALRNTHPSRMMCREAADEIERLVARDTRLRCLITDNPCGTDTWGIPCECANCQTWLTEPVRAFAKAVLHGDDEHKAWLLEAAEAFIDRKPLPAQRGRGAQSDAEPVRSNRRGDTRTICNSDGSCVQEICLVSGNPGEWRILVRHSGRATDS